MIVTAMVRCEDVSIILRHVIKYESPGEQLPLNDACTMYATDGKTGGPGPCVGLGLEPGVPVSGVRGGAGICRVLAWVGSDHELVRRPPAHGYSVCLED